VVDVNKKIMENEKCYYYKKLSENIVNFYNEIIYENDKIFPFKKKLNSIVLKVINNSLNTLLKPYNIINLIVYGSQASGLSLPESDIDLLLIYCDSNNNSLDKFISELYNILLTSKKFNNVISLPKASSPLIKIEYEINSYNNYYNSNNISLIHMDISFHNIYPNKNTIYYTPSLLIVKYIQKSIEYLPQSKNIIIVIKKYLKNLGLNNYYTGGLNSFSIFIMVFAFYKYEIKILGNDSVNNFYIGQFLVQFLDFYSKFNFNEFIININKDIPFIIKSTFNENKNMKQNDNSNAVILDPFTLNNIACNSFRICEIQQKFDSLKQNLLVNYDKNYKVKNIYNTGYKRRYRYRNYYNNNNMKISFDEYEKEIDFYNGDIIPNFLEMSIN
jgi:DNA polymerase sigma